jgi:hypothetical protein
MGGGSGCSQLFKAGGRREEIRLQFLQKWARIIDAVQR